MADDGSQRAGPSDAASRAPAQRHPDPRFRPRLTLRTLTRGDGLLGLKPFGPVGARSEPVTVATLDWTDPGDGSIARRIDAAAAVDPEDDARAEATLRSLGLHPVPAEALQWRSADLARLAIGDARLWTTTQEDQFADLWADELPRLQARGWAIAVRPGFAHESVPVDVWRIVIAPESGEPLRREVAAPMRGRGTAVAALRGSRREGSWLLTLGVEVGGEVVDLAPLLADLLKRDGRWLDAEALAAIADTAPIRLRAPGGKRIDTTAGALKPIIAGMLDLLTQPRRSAGPWRVSRIDAARLQALGETLQASQAERAGAHGRWQLEGDAGLHALAQRLREAGSPPPVEPPQGLAIELRPYQRQGLAWLQYLREHHLAGILADDMGLGKTAQTLAHVLLEKEAGRLDRPALVVLPTTLVFNWQAEARRMAPALRVLTLQGPARADDFARMAEHDLVLTSFALVWRDLDALKRQPFHLLVLDEAQTVKSPTSRGARAVRRLTARHRLCLTGTPLENHLGELWTQFDFLLPGFLGDARSFQRHWRRPIEVGGETLRAQLLAQRVRPFVLRRRKDDVAAELPPKTEVIRRLRLEGQQRDLYESVRVAADRQVRRVLQRSSFKGAQISVLAALLTLRQVCCDPHLVKGRDLPAGMERAKLELLREMLPTLAAEGRRVLVFSQFTEMLGLLGHELDALGQRWISLTGDTPPARRADVVSTFQRGDVPLFLLSLKAGGLGLNLTAADTVIHIDPWWNPAVEVQATDRAHRIGQVKPVTVYKLVIEGSIEERILALQGRKKGLAEAVLGVDGAGNGKFAEEELEGLLAPLGE